MAGDLEARKSRWSRAPEFYGAGLFLAYAGVIVLHASVPSLTDYANWTYQGVLLARHLQGLPDAAHVLKMYPVPNSAATLGIGGLALLLPWQLAAKVYLCLQLLVSFLALRQFARAAGASGAVWFIVPQAVFFSVNWWYGFVNFELGLAWAMLMAAMLLRRVRGAGGLDGWLGVLLVTTFFTHMIPFAFCCLLVVLFAAQTRRWRTLWHLVPSACLGAWYIFARFELAGDADGQAGMVATVRDYSLGFWAYKVNSYAKSFGFANPTEGGRSVALHAFGPTAFLVLLGVSAVPCLALAWAMAAEVLKVYRAESPERFLWTGLLLLLPLYWLAPGTALGVSDPGSRLLQVSLALALVLVCRSGGVLLRVASGCGLTLAVAGIFLFATAGFAVEAPVPSKRLRVLEQFAHVPNHDQDRFYRALEQGEYGAEVFPTGMYLNQQEGKDEHRGR